MCFPTNGKLRLKLAEESEGKRNRREELNHRMVWSVVWMLEILVGVEVPVKTSSARPIAPVLPRWPLSQIGGKLRAELR